MDQSAQTQPTKESRGEKRKLTWLLILQAWAMLWVVIGHSPLPEPATHAAIDTWWCRMADLFYDFAYSFHMPLFIMISGYLFNMTRVAKGWSYRDTVAEKWWRLGLPYIFFILLATLLKIAMPGAVDREVELTPTTFVMSFVDPYNSALREMWFVAVIFIYFLLYPLYPRLLKSKAATVVTLVVAVGLFFIPVARMTNLFAINRAIHSFVFFFVGMAISNYKLERYIMRPVTIVVSLAAYAAAMFWQVPLLAPLGGSIAFWGLAIVVDKALSDNLFSSFRNYTYQIFLIGIFVQMAVKVLYNKIHFPGSYAVWWTVCVLVGIYVPVVVSRLVSRHGNPWAKKLIGM